MVGQKLTASKVKSLSSPGKYADRDGLYLNITKQGNKSWIYRYQLLGRRREMGLGSLKQCTLAEARVLAADARKLHKSGIDPQKARMITRTEQAPKTFKECAEAYIGSHKSGWKNAKHVSQWENTLAQYAYPTIGALPVKEVDTALVMEVIQPIWNNKTETASRVRGRMERILSWAIVQGYRGGPNPALWRGHLSMLLPPRSKVQKVRHHKAMAYTDMPVFMMELRKRQTISSRALEFTILTCARTSEAICAKWDEIDFDLAIWVVPASRMKAGREHRVALSQQAVTLLSALPRASEWVFPGARLGRPISNMAMLKYLKQDMGHSSLTVHGFRSTFRDWVAEVSHYSGSLAEAALAHQVANAVEAAYQRGDMLEKRRDMMHSWAEFIC